MGSVFKGMLKPTGTIIAVKHIRDESEWESKGFSRRRQASAKYWQETDSKQVPRGKDEKIIAQHALPFHTFAPHSLQFSFSQEL
jgi:hypothetical protein